MASGQTLDTRNQAWKSTNTNKYKSSDKILRN